MSDAPDDVTAEQVRGAIAIGTEPAFEIDVAYRIGQLVDIAERSISTGSSDATTATEAVLHLGVVLRELLLSDLPPTRQVDGSDRQLLRTRELGLADYLDAAFARLRAR